MEDDLHRMELRQVRGMAFLRGALVIGAILMTAVQWYALRQLDRLDHLAERIAVIEQRISALEGEIKGLQENRNGTPDHK